jgi:hypothetical protein
MNWPNLLRKSPSPISKNLFEIAAVTRSSLRTHSVTAEALGGESVPSGHFCCRSFVGEVPSVQ